MQSSHKNKKNKKGKNKKLAKLKTWKGDLGNRERPDGLKTRKGGPGKIRGTKKEYTLGGLKAWKGGPGKIKDFQNRTKNKVMTAETR